MEIITYGLKLAELKRQNPGPDIVTTLVEADVDGEKLNDDELGYFIILLAVGCDYNLLLVARFKEEMGAGLKTGIIRTMGGTGKVVTAAGLVFAFTMASFAFSDLKVMAQVGTTIALGLLFDTLIVRSFMTPAIAAMLGRWFWWPQVIQSAASKRRLAALQQDRDTQGVPTAQA